MTIKIYICEDSTEQRTQLIQAVTAYTLFSATPMELAFASDSADELLQKIDRNNQLNVYFLDINLDKAATDTINNGFLLAQEIRKFDPLGFIIFITVRSELSFLTFQYKVAALDFIIKSQEVDLDNRVKECLNTVCSRLDTLNQGIVKSIKLNTGLELTTFMFSDIRYFATNKNHVLSLYTQGSEYEIYQNSLSSLEQELKDEFIRCHRSFLVNRQLIHSIAKNYSTLYLSDGTEIPVAARKKSLLKKELGS